MNNKSPIKSIFINTCIILLSLITILGLGKSIFIGIDMDESYAITQSYRIVLGDQSFFNMWEPHQMSAYLTTMLMQIYMNVTGSVDYLVIFLRACGTFIHITIACLFCFALRDTLTKQCNIILFLLQVNFLSKWIQVPEFELMQYWFLILTFLCMYFYYNKHTKIYILSFAGLFIMLQTLNYPTMILLYPIYVLGIYMQHKHVIKETLYMTGGAILGGILYLFYIFKNVSLENFITALGFITSDPSHTQRTMLESCIIYLKELALDILIIAVFLLILLLIMKVVHQKTKTTQKITSAFCITAIIYCLTCSFGFFILDQNQFFLQSRYLVIFLLGLYLLTITKNYTNILSIFGIFPSTISFLLALLVTNMDVNTQYSKLFSCAIFIFVLFAPPKKEPHVITPRLYYALTLCTLLPLLLCRTALLRVTGCLPVTIMAPLTEITTGALKGIYALDKVADNYNAFPNLSDYIDETDTVFYFGHDPLIYLYQSGNIGTFSVQGTAVFNEDALTYYEIFPDKSPSVIIVDKTYNYDYYFTYSPYNYIVADWISDLKTVPLFENNYIQVLRIAE